MLSGNKNTNQRECLLLYIERAIFKATLNRADHINIRHRFINVTPDIVLLMLVDYY